MTAHNLRFSDGNDADDGLSWANAKLTQAGVFAIPQAAGDITYMSDNHAETQASSMTLTAPGTAAAPSRIYCVDDAGNPNPPTAMATTGTIEATGNGSNMAFAGYAISDGVTFKAGLTTNGNAINFISSSAWGWTIKNGGLVIGGNNSTNRVVVGVNAANGGRGILRLLDSTISFAQAAQGITLRDFHLFEWKKGGFVGTIPTGGIFKGQSGFVGRVEMEGLDLNSIGTNPLFDLAADWCGKVYIKRCKLPSGFVPKTGSFAGPHSMEMFIDNCDSGDTNYKMWHLSYAGDITQETTIVRTGGASDNVTPISWKFVSSANVCKEYPLKNILPIVYKNTVVGTPITVDVEVVLDGVTPTDAEIWAEYSYLGVSGVPQALFADDHVATPLTTPANQTTSSATWTTTGLGSPLKFKLSKTFTAQEIGTVQVTVCVGKASTTVYACPKAVRS